MPLDNLPYGEELIRIEKLPTQIQAEISNLEGILKDHIPQNVASKNFKKAEKTIQDAQDTLDECTKIPDSNDDNDE